MKKKRQKKTRKYAVKKTNRAVYFFMSFIVTIMLIVSFACFLLIDKNTCRVGWSEDKVELAWSYQGSRLDLTLMGKGYTLDMSPLTSAAEGMQKINDVGDIVEPPACRLRNMLLDLLIKEAYRVYFK